jgi:polyisoprenoid-binding protein YceI
MRKSFFLAGLVGVASLVYSTQKTAPIYQESSMLEVQAWQHFLKSQPIPVQKLKDFEYFLEVKKSNIQWQTHYSPERTYSGEAKFKSGSILMSRENKITGGEFVIEVNKTGTGCVAEKPKANLENSLKSADFLAVDKSPQAFFKLKTAKHIYKFNQFSESEQVMLTGELTIKGISHSISFMADYQEVKGSIKIQANFNIDANKWGFNPPANPIMDSLETDNPSETQITLQLEFMDGC